jgi:hypothetical protein
VPPNVLPSCVKFVIDIVFNSGCFPELRGGSGG